MSIMVNVGAGFIGANFLLNWFRHHGDMGDSTLITRLLAEHTPRAVINFSAESHVDRSIHGPEEFIQTNIVGTFQLLESVRWYWESSIVRQ